MVFLEREAIFGGLEVSSKEQTSQKVWFFSSEKRFLVVSGGAGPGGNRVGSDLFSIYLSSRVISSD